jgi:Restriction endonuclease
MPRSVGRKRSSKRVPRVKQGRPYELAVTEIFKQLMPSAKIECGKWVVGPDGRRELDVYIEDHPDGRVVRGIVECKDFNPQTTGPVGIGYVDALESKRLDIGCDFSMICSNAGFTADAIRKARRVGIGLIGAMRAGDSRIRFDVIEEVYSRRIKINAAQIRLFLTDGQPPLPNDNSLMAESFTIDGRSVDRWFNIRFAQILSRYPIVRGNISDYCNLKTPLVIQYPGGQVQVNKIGMDYEFEGAWFAHTVRIEATSGIYNWVRRRTKIASGQLKFDGLDLFGGSWIESQPVFDKYPLQPNEVDMAPIAFKHSFDCENPALLDAHVIPEDMSLVLENLDPESMKSSYGFA